MEAFVTILSIATYVGLVYTIPPQQCFANFRWDDCGKSPQAVIYYWKPAARCEVGIWRGCLPNINMFRDEYECVSTCIFTIRAAAPDWHKLSQDFEQDTTETTTDFEYGGNTTEYDNSTSVNSTALDANETVTGGGDATDVTTVGDAGGDATTVAGDGAGGDDAGGDGAGGDGDGTPAADGATEGAAAEEPATEEAAPEA